jgi:hypothetical protein
MISLAEALSWLNQFDCCHISAASKVLIQNMNVVPPVKIDRLEYLINTALSGSQSAIDRMEYPEMLLNCAAVNFHRNRLSRAYLHLKEAYQLYSSHVHRKSVASWMLGIIEWKLEDNGSAFLHWNETRTIFEKQIEAGKKTKDQVFVVWYQDRLGLVNVDLALTAEEAYYWLYMFKQYPLVLEGAVLQIRNAMIENYRRKLYPKVWQMMGTFQRIAKASPNYLAYPQALVECGLLAHEIGSNEVEAIRLLKEAVACFPPKSHYQVAARWMLGVMQWRVESEKEAAIKNWQLCQETFEELAISADRQNLQSRRSWYKEKARTMRLALEEKINTDYL